jgi:voltage-gated potassium channel
VTPRPITSALLALFAIFAIGVGGYMYLERWTFLESLWMVTITLTTIGFGEIHPLTDLGRWFTMGLIVAGVSVGAYATTQLTSLVLEGQMSGLLRHQRRQAELDKLQNHFIVVGFGRLGRTVVEELIATGVPVCVVERDPTNLAELERLRLCPVVVGDGSTDEVLKQAGILRARGVAVAVSSGAEAVFVTLSVRELNPKIPIITRVSDAEHAVKARRAGATSVVSPHTMGGWRMAHGLVRPHATSFLDLATLASHEDILLEEYQLPPNSPANGLSLGSLKIGEHWHVLVIAIRHADGKMVPTPGAAQMLGKGDVIIVVGAPAPVRNFGRWLLVQPD